MLFSRLTALAQAVVRSAAISSDETREAGVPGADVPLGEDLTAGDLVLKWLVARFGRENGGETINRCERLVQLLAPGEDGLSPWRPVVLTTNEPIALTAPGRVIYVTEGILQLVGDDDAPLALALAHEIAHHQLGHVAGGTASRWRDWLGEAGGLPIIAAACVNRSLFSADQESAADREGLALCHRRGFDLSRCVALFDILERYQDDARAMGDPLPFDWLEPSTPFRAWVRERLSGYPTFAARREAAQVQRILLEQRGIT